MDDYIQMAVIGMLLLLGGVFSGLSLGLMQLDPNRLKIVMKAGTARQQKWAKTIYPIRKNGNYLLCVLLVGNVLTNNTLAILLEQLTGGITAIVASTASIVVFGEIIPQALCGRHPLWTGAKSIGLTWFFYVVLWPVAYPVSLLLNAMLGEEIGVFYLRDELTQLLKLTQGHSDLERDELGILDGGLSLQSTCVEEVMKPIHSATMIEASVPLDRKTIEELRESFFSRIPVYLDNKDNVIGVLLVHDLLSTALKIDLEPEPVLAKTCMTPCSPSRMRESTSLAAAFKTFKAGDVQLALVYNSHEHIIGLLTVNDVTEYVLGARFPDEKLVRRKMLSDKKLKLGPGFRSSSSSPQHPPAAPALYSPPTLAEEQREPLMGRGDKSPSELDGEKESGLSYGATTTLE